MKLDYHFTCVTRGDSDDAKTSNHHHQASSSFDQARKPVMGHHCNELPMLQM